MSKRKYVDLAEPAHHWWVERNSGSSRDRAAMARLRRASTVLEVLQVQEALWLVRKMPNSQLQERATVLAGVLACVREDEPERKIARAIGRETMEDDTARMSESRFRRLLQSDDRSFNEFLDAMRRLVQLANGKVNVKDLSRSILYWNDRTKKEWIFEYYRVFEDRNPKEDN